MRKLMLGLTAALVLTMASEAARADQLVCEDSYNGYKLTVDFTDGNGSERKGKGKLEQNGYEATTLDCTLKQGTTSYLHCGSKSDWEVKVTIGGFDAMNLTRYGRVAGTLVCH